jgi:transcriptional regulator with XRE-family HTH domain
MSRERENVTNDCADGARDWSAVGARLAEVSDARLGVVLRDQRERAGASRRDVAVRGGITYGRLRAVESGRRRPAAATVGRLMDAYGCTIDDLLPPRGGLDPAMFAGVSDADIVRHYVALVETWRGAQVVEMFRSDDVRVLVGILGTDPAAIERELRQLTGCSRVTARRFGKVLAISLAASAGVIVASVVAAAAAGAHTTPGPTTARPPVAVVVTTVVAPTAPSTPIVVCPSPEPVAVATSMPQAAAVGGGTAVSLTVAAYADVRTDAAGTPVAVRTNTGDPPGCDGPWQVFASTDAVGEPVIDIAFVNRVVAVVQASGVLPAPGGWQPGTWYPLA